MIKKSFKMRMILLKMMYILMIIGFMIRFGMFISYADSSVAKDSQTVDDQASLQYDYTAGKFLGHYYAWNASTLQINGHLTCQAFTISEKKIGYVSIDHTPSLGVINEIIVLSNRSFKKDSVVKILIDGAYTYYFQSYGVYAMQKKSKDLKKLLSNLTEESRVMTVSGIDKTGSTIRLQFSLQGAGSAYNVINRACTMQ